MLQSIGELLISPIGYAMIGKLAPKQYQGVMMGSWMLVTGLASLFAGDFSGMIPEPSRHHGGRHQPRLLEALRRARLRQPRGRRRARRADSVPAQADHRQGRDASRRKRRLPSFPSLEANGRVTSKGPSRSGVSDEQERVSTVSERVSMERRDVTVGFGLDRGNLALIRNSFLMLRHGLGWGVLTQYTGLV